MEKTQQGLSKKRLPKSQKRNIDPVLMQEKGLRLRQLRTFCGMDREEFAERYQLAALTLRDWELAVRNSIPLKKAEILADKLRKDDVVLNTLWLEHGIGCEPIRLHRERLRNLSRDPEELNIQIDVEKQINDELTMFMLGHPETIAHIIEDEAMAPFYHRGDIVAGIKCGKQNILTCIGKDCIIVTEDNKILLRRVQEGKNFKTFSLLPLNLNAGQEMILCDREPEQIAPVLWVRHRGGK